MFALFDCVAEAIIESGIQGLAELVPGGPFLHAIAESAWKKYSSRCKSAEQRDEICKIIQSSTDQILNASRSVSARLVGASRPELDLLEAYLAQLQSSTRRSFKRAEDPTGTTVPDGFAMTSSEPMLQILPSFVPRHRVGQLAPHKPGWRLQKLLGLGGFGEVWLAHHESLRSLRGAVKFCRIFRDSDKALLHESKVIDRLLASGSHPNVIPLLDAQVDGEDPWLMYEYVEGGDLNDLIRRWAMLPMERRRQLAMQTLVQLAETMGQFHRKTPQIVHRDLKPANILLDVAQRRLRITDFGIGAIAASHFLGTHPVGASTYGVQLGSYLHGSHTPLYASPQQRDGMPPDPRDDVYALGVLGYQILTGQIDRGIGPDIDEDLREVDVPEPVVQLLRRCTAHKPERRPADAQVIFEELSALRSDRIPNDRLNSVNRKNDKQESFVPKAHVQPCNRAPRGVMPKVPSSKVWHALKQALPHRDWLVAICCFTVAIATSYDWNLRIVDFEKVATLAAMSAVLGSIGILTLNLSVSISKAAQSRCGRIATVSIAFVSCLAISAAFVLLLGSLLLAFDHCRKPETFVVQIVFAGVLALSAMRNSRDVAYAVLRRYFDWRSPGSPPISR